MKHNTEPLDGAAVAAALLVLDYDPDRIVSTLAEHFPFTEAQALELVHYLLTRRIELDHDPQAAWHLQAIAAEWNLDQTMHGGTQ